MYLRFLSIWLLIVLSTGQAVAQSSNPFEIQSRLDSLYAENPVTVVDAPVVSEDISTGIELDTENPFNVDHVPLRKSTLETSSKLIPKKQKTDSKEANPILVFFTCLVSLFLLAIVATTRRSLFGKLLKSLGNDNFLKLTYREENAGRNGPFLILYLIFLINAATLAYLFIGQDRYTGWQMWGFLFGGISLIYIMRNIFMNVISWIFPVERETRQYNFLITVFNAFLGLILLPLNLVAAYGPQSMTSIVMYTALIIIGLFYLLRSARGFLLGLINYGSQVFHFFLYLCAFEIVPILLIIRVLRDLSTVS